MQFPTVWSSVYWGILHFTSLSTWWGEKPAKSNFQKLPCYPQKAIHTFQTTQNISAGMSGTLQFVRDIRVKIRHFFQMMNLMLAQLFCTLVHIKCGFQHMFYNWFE
jgi:hypothetical protein